ncbi:MAG: pilus assembly protein [Anaerolineales bacterium]|nr:pilus assembly protein [Anaerolineales bacterium]
MSIFTKRKKGKGRKKAQAMVEFALVIPLVLLMLVGIIEFSRLLFAWIIIENSTRFGIRYATTGNFEEPYCDSVGNADGTCDEEAEEDAARIPPSRMRPGASCWASFCGMPRSSAAQTPPFPPQMTITLTSPSVRRKVGVFPFSR